MNLCDIKLSMVKLKAIAITDTKISVDRDHVNDDNFRLYQVVRPKVPFFLVEFDDGSRLFHRVIGRIPLQFGR